MRRREFITLLGGAVAWPLAARAQQRTFPVIGLLSSRSPAVDTPLIAVIRQGLIETGFVEGQNVAVDYRWAVHTVAQRLGRATEMLRRRELTGCAIIGHSAVGGSGWGEDEFRFVSLRTRGYASL